MASHERLGKGLARFEPRGRLAWTENEPAGARESIDDAEAERQLRPDDGDVDGFACGEIDELLRIAQIRGMDGPERGHSGVAGGADDRPGMALAGQAGGKRVLAGTAAEDQNSHDMKRLQSVERNLAGPRGPGRFR